MLETFRNVFGVPELRKRMGWTLLLLFIYRLGSAIPLPGVNLDQYREMMAHAQEGAMGRVLGLASALSGGVMHNFSIFYMGIMPYISASIVFQILTKVVPVLEQASKDPAGRRDITKWTRWATVGVAVIQGLMHAYHLKRPSAEYSLVYDPTFMGFVLPTVLSMTAGTLFLMWLGEQITEYGVGNGISLIIMAGIVARAPAVIGSVGHDLTLGNLGWGTVGALFGLFLFMIISIILVTQAERRVPMQSARQIRGRMAVGGQRTFFPLKLNAAGVIPVIFASALLTFPAYLILGLCEMNGWTQNWIYLHVPGFLTREHGFFYMVAYASLIYLFTYFYTAMIFNPADISENLKQMGAFIPGIRPGRNTAEFIERTMNRVTFAGAAFLAFVSLVPTLVHSHLNVSPEVASFLGGTSLLIVVGVGLDLVRKIESHLLVRQYKGFLGGGTPMRGR